MGILPSQRVATKNKRLENLRRIAEMNGGQCLAQRYIHTSKKLLWKCKNGHEWEASPTNIIHNKSWCPVCSKHSSLSEEKCRYIFEMLTGDKFKRNRVLLGGKELDGYSDKLEVAFEYNGRQHYEIVTHFKIDQTSLTARQKTDNQKFELCQALGIKLIVVPYWVKSDTELVDFIRNELTLLGIYTRELTNLDGFYASRHDFIQQMKEIAQEKGGTFLSQVYRGANIKHRWRCKQGHEWDATPQSIKQRSWCPMCAFQGINRKYSTNIVLDWAKQHGGVCLDNYKNNSTVMRWQCCNSHIFNSTFDNLRLRVKSKGIWCLECERSRRGNTT